MSRETDEKIERVARVAREMRLGGILMATQRNFAWITGGQSNRIDGSREPGAGSLFVTADGRRFVLANAIEMPRLVTEALDGLSFEPVEYPWIEEQANPVIAIDRVRSKLRAPLIGSDWPLPGTTAVEAALMRARVVLVDEEVDRYRRLGCDVGAALGDVCRSVVPGLTEQEVADRVAAAVHRANARPVVVLIAGDDRIERYRHPVPTSTPWKHTLMVVVCAERHGLIVSLTRLVTSGKTIASFHARTYATARVFAELLKATRAGTSGAALYDVASRAYAAVGFGGEERRHHQGGATGYRTREWVAHPASAETVAARQAFAWNPSITGTKIEDTILLVDGRMEVVTTSPGWPTIPIETREETLHASGALEL